MADITIVNGVYKPTYNWGAPSCGIEWDAKSIEKNPGQPSENGRFY